MSAPPPNPHAQPSDPTSAATPASPPSLKKTWVWITAAAVALVFTGIMIGVVVPQLGGGDSDEAAGESVTETETPGEPGAQDATAVTWPANMATGGIVFTGAASGMDIVRSDAPDAQTAPTPRDAAELGEQAIIHLYLDYRCPYCAQFEEANQEVLERVLQNGEAALEVHPLTFLDRPESDDLYSSRAASAVACVASEQPEAAWDAHGVLSSTAFQPADDASQHSGEVIAAAIDDAIAGDGGLNDETRACIVEERHGMFMQSLNQWWFSNPVPGSDGLTVQGTPFAVVNGVPYGGAPADSEAFASFLTQQGIATQ